MTTTTPPLRDVVRANIRAELSRQGMTTATLATALGLTSESVRRKLRGETPVSFDDVDAIAVALGIERDRLLAT